MRPSGFVAGFAPSAFLDERDCRPGLDRNFAASAQGELSLVAAWERQQYRGVQLPLILTVPGRSTTTIDHPSSVGRTQPSDADR